MATSFALNGAIFSTVVSRLPDVREGLGIDNGALGLLVLAMAAGSMIGLPLSGRLTDLIGAANVVRAGTVMCAVGLVTIAYGAGPAHSAACTAAALFLFGVGTGIWDVAHNIVGADIERQSGRILLPQLHGTWSIAYPFPKLRL